MNIDVKTIDIISSLCNFDHQRSLTILSVTEKKKSFEGTFVKNLWYMIRFLSEDHDSSALFSKLLNGFVATEKIIHPKVKGHSGHEVKFSYSLKYSINFRKYHFHMPVIFI